MKNFIKLSFLLLALLLPAIATAQDFEVDGNYYIIINDNEVSFTHARDGIPHEYRGDIDIPATVTYGGTTYWVTAISEYAFNSCKGLLSVTIPNSVTEIGEYAFIGCTGLKSVMIGNSVSTIGEGVFSGCSGLTSINIPNSVTNIGQFVFSGCSGLTSINISNSITKIDIRTFEGCSGLTNISIPNSVSFIDEGAFIECTGLTNIIIPNSVTTIGDRAFKYCSSLTSIDIPNSVTSIGDEAFWGCSGLTSVNIHDLDAWCKIDFNNFYSNPLYYAHRLFIDGEETTDLVIPESVTSIGGYAFYGCTGLTSVTIGKSVTSIGGYAFYGCTGLTSVTIPNSVTSIGEGVFYNCAGLKSVTLGNSVSTIGDYAFYGCSGLSDVYSYITDLSKVSMGSNVFYLYPDNYDERTLHVPYGTLAAYQADTKWNNYFGAIVEMEEVIDFADPNVKALCIQNWDTNGDGELSMSEAAAVTSIGTVFKSNTNITSFDEFKYFTGLTATGYQAFSGCSNLASIELPSSIYLIGGYAFFNCSSMTSFSIPHTITQINYEAFGNCTGLTSITIPSSVDTIGERVFRGCSGLASIIVENGNPTYDSRGKCNAIIETASNTLITGCQNTVIPNSITAINGYAFWGCVGMTSITIPNSVISIGNYAFYNCTALTEVTCFATTPPVIGGTNTFPSAITSHATLYVPIGTKSTYQAADYWKNFFNIVEIEVLATSIELNVVIAQMTLDETLQLSASVMPKETTNKVVTWTSSDPFVATVDEDGLVIGVSVGTATITATTTDGSNLSASCTVTVGEVVNIEGNYFSMADTTVRAGEIIVIPVCLTNEDDITAFQTDIYLPDGFEIVQEDGYYAVDLSSRKTKSHVIMANETDNGAIRVISYTPNIKPFAGNEGELFFITLRVPEDVDSTCTLWLRNTFLTTTDEEEISIDDVSCDITVYSFILGDVNNSGTVTVTDIVVTAKYILNYNPQPFVFAAADVNNDGNITVTDVVKIARLVMGADLNMPSFMAPPAMSQNDRMSGEAITLMPGETRTVSITLDNAVDYSAFQLDLMLPDGLTASNFHLTDRAGSHTLDVNTVDGGKQRALCYSPAITAITGNDGAILTFDVTASGPVSGDIIVNDIEMVTTACQTVTLDAFSIGVNNNATSVDDLIAGRTVARIDYFNLSGQQIDRPESGVTLVVTTYTDGARAATKLLK